MTFFAFCKATSVDCKLLLRAGLQKLRPRVQGNSCIIVPRSVLTSKFCYLEAP